jgi:DNA-binding transcriptional MocR family regulator
LADAVGAGILFAPGAQFNHDGRPSRCLRLTYAMADSEALRSGVTTLARVVRERMNAEPGVTRVHI